MNTLKKQYSRLKSAASTFAPAQSINVPAKSSFAYTLINFTAKGAALILTPIFTRILTASEYGEYSLFSSYLSLALVIGSLELSGGVITRAYQRSPRTKHLTFLCACGLCLIVTVPVSVSLYIAKRVTGGGLSFSYAYLFLFLSTISSSVINLYLSRCRYQYKWVPSLIATVIQSIIAPIFSIAVIEFAISKHFDHVGAKIGTLTVFMSATAIVMVILSCVEARKEIRSEALTRASIFPYIKETVRFLLKMSLPLLPYYFSIIVISMADKVIISEFMGKDVLGKYSVAYSAGISLSAITAGLYGALCPWIMRKVRANDFSPVKKVLGAIISICSSVIICFNALIPDVFRILAPNEYTVALPVAFIASLIPIPLVLTQCMSSIAIAKERIGGVIICGVVPAALSVALNRLLIPEGRIYVGALVTAISYICLSVLSIMNTSRLTKETPVDPAKALRSFLVLALVVASLYIFREYTIFRLAAGLAGVAALIYNLKSSVALLKDK